MIIDVAGRLLTRRVNLLARILAQHWIRYHVFLASNYTNLPERSCGAMPARGVLK